jgi:hypothetical protein
MPADDLGDLIAALEDAGCTVRGKAVVCAFHGDHSASGSIYQGTDGRHRYRCHACPAAGDAADIVALCTGRPLLEILRERSEGNRMSNNRPHHRKPEPKRWPDLEALVADLHQRNQVSDVYRYKDTAGAVLMAVVRLEPKSFRQASPAPGGGWWLKKPPGLLPILNRPAIAAAELVVVVEGEKDANVLHEVGVIATTSPMGADSSQVPIEDDGKPGLADWSPLAGKRVVLWGDDDEPGRRHINRVARVLGRLYPRPSLYRVRREDLDGTKDAADMIAGTASEEAARFAILRIIDNALPLRPAAPLHARIEAAIAGKLVAAPWPWTSVGGLTSALLPGAVSLLVGSPGASKSFMLLQAALWWLEEGWRVALYELEEGNDFWLNRALALLAGASCAMDPAWLAGHPDEARTLLARYARELDTLAACMTCAPAGGVTLEGLAAWIEAQAAAGVRIIAADPVTAAMEDSASKPWIAAQAFMLRTKRAATTAGASLVFTSHGRKGDRRGGKMAPDLDSLAGGAAYARFASTVLWLESMAEAEGCAVIDADGRDIHTDINRRLRILKARNGCGTGRVLGLRFNGATLRMEEAGVIINDAAHAPCAAPRIIAGSGRDRAAGGQP